MTPEDPKQMRNMISEGFEQVIVPVLTEMQATMQHMQADISDMKDTLSDHTIKLDRMERMLTVDIRRTDEHSVEIKRIKKHIGMK